MDMDRLYIVLFKIICKLTPNIHLFLMHITHKGHEHLSTKPCYKIDATYGEVD